MINRKFIMLCYQRRNYVIEVERWIFISPCIIVPVYNYFFLFSCWIDQKCRSVITAPRIISWMKKKFYFTGINVFCLQLGHSETLHCFISNIDADFFTSRQLFYESTIVWINGVDFSRPAYLFVGPAQPRSCMRSKFSG